MAIDPIVPGTTNGVRGAEIVNEIRDVAEGAVQASGPDYLALKSSVLDRVSFAEDQPRTASEKAVARRNIGADYGIEILDTSSIVSGVLTLPEMGEQFVLSGHGGSDITISSLGASRPAGRRSRILIPRTAPMTGAPASALGNKVSFVHAPSGAGLDMTMNARIVDGALVYDYDAYPDASNSVGDICALYEELEFVSLGGGRHRLIRLPDPIFQTYESGTDFATVVRLASGEQQVGRRTSITVGASTSQTDKNIDWTVPFTKTPVSATTALSSYGNSLATSYITIQSATGCTLRAVNTRDANNNAGTCLVSVNAIGPWK